MDFKEKAGIKAYLAAPVMILIGFTIASLVFTYIIKDPSPVPVFIIFCSIQFICMVLFALLPGKGKDLSRSAAMFLIGPFILIMAGIFGRTNFQIEGFFFYLMSGTMSGVIIHFAMAKILGPILFNRSWCSWGCWTSMILDLLPYKTNTSWEKGSMRIIRYFYFGVSLLVITFIYFGLKETILNSDQALKNGMGTITELMWFLIGNSLYYIIGISLAITMKDNRAFCKYICPLTVLYKSVTRFSLLRIAGDYKKCTNCKNCVSKCPMSIDIPSYIKNGERVKSTECILCMNCIATCPQASLKTSVRLDFANKDYLH